MSKLVSIYIKDMIENMDMALHFMSGITADALINDKKTYYAIIRCLEIIGEAAKRVPDKIRTKYTEIPWRDMAGLRDKVIHFYSGIDFKIILEVINKDIPKVKPLLEKVYQELIAGGH